MIPRLKKYLCGYVTYGYKEQSFKIKQITKEKIMGSYVINCWIDILINWTVPVYRIPSLLLQGDDATSCGIVKGSFLRVSLSELARTYKEPSLGSGKNSGLKFKLNTEMIRDNKVIVAFKYQFSHAIINIGSEAE